MEANHLLQQNKVPLYVVLKNKVTIEKVNLYLNILS